MTDELPKTKLLQIEIPQKIYKRIVKKKDLVKIDEIITRLPEKKYRKV